MPAKKPAKKATAARQAPKAASAKDALDPKYPATTDNPEEHIREESLHKSSTDLTARDIAEVPPDMWFVEAQVVLRGDSEEEAVNKIAAGFGINADVRSIKGRRATPKDLGQ